MVFIQKVGVDVILSLVATFLFYTFAFRRITRSFFDPFNEIIASVDRLGKGDLTTKIAATDNSLKEIAQLSDSLDTTRQEFEENRKRFEMISHLKSEFISIAAHQLRTPLTAIKWAIDTVKKGDLGIVTKEQQDMLQRGSESNDRIILLVGDLLNAAKVEEGKFGYTFTQSNITEIIADSIATNSLLAKEHTIEVLFNPEPDIPKVKLDKEKIKLAMDNLLGNAIKYSKRGGHITISVARHKEHFLEVRISDQGIGIPKANMDRIFTKFFRGENAVKQQTEGSGLGLFITKNIILNHGGEISVESEENVGSTFHFTIPIEEGMLPTKELTFEDFFQTL
ncbi:MAG: HAMP domain-containing sensor histidine kinase [Candidatus Paceibacterota bacterium]